MDNTTLTDAALEDHAKPDRARFELVIVEPSGSLRRVRLDQGAFQIGRSRTAELAIGDLRASRRHARLVVGDVVSIEDLGSANGTRVGAVSLVQGSPRRLEPNDVIAIGSTIFILRQVSGGDPAGTQGDAPRATSSVSTIRSLRRVTTASMQRVYELAEIAAKTTISLLITGETGVGKEILARDIHVMSLRASLPLVCINCAALSENLLESELFGHERGAFTGADRAKRGLLETANGGTVFLDEIGELPLGLQAKLLRVLETREVQRVGSVRTQQLDLRFVAATNRDLRAEVRKGTFRRDLFYRLNGIELAIPPLRERRGDILDLARDFLRSTVKDLGRSTEPILSVDTALLLEQHSWPGNVRELRNAIARAVALSSSELRPEHLMFEAPESSPFPPSQRAAPRSSARPSSRLSRPPAAAPSLAAAAAPSAGFDRSTLPPAVPVARLGGVDAGERQRILEALSSCAGNQSRAAKLLGMPRRTFVAKLDAYRIPRPRKAVDGVGRGSGSAT